MSKPRGIKRKVENTHVWRTIQGHPVELKLVLECAHITFRPIKRRLNRMSPYDPGDPIRDPDPTWVYCKQCSRETK